MKELEDYPTTPDIDIIKTYFETIKSLEADGIIPINKHAEMNEIGFLFYGETQFKDFAVDCTVRGNSEGLPVDGWVCLSDYGQKTAREAKKGFPLISEIKIDAPTKKDMEINIIKDSRNIGKLLSHLKIVYSDLSNEKLEFLKKVYDAYNTKEMKDRIDFWKSNPQNTFFLEDLVSEGPKHVIDYLIARKFIQQLSFSSFKRSERFYTPTEEGIKYIEEKSLLTQVVV